MMLFLLVKCALKIWNIFTSSGYIYSKLVKESMLLFSLLLSSEKIYNPLKFLLQQFLWIAKKWELHKHSLKLSWHYGLLSFSVKPRIWFEWTCKGLDVRKMYFSATTNKFQKQNCLLRIKWWCQGCNLLAMWVIVLLSSFYLLFESHFYFYYMVFALYTH